MLAIRRVSGAEGENLELCHSGTPSPPTPSLVYIFVPGLIINSIKNAGGANFFLKEPPQKLPQLLHIARSYFAAGQLTGTELTKIKLQRKAWFALNVTAEELKDWINKGTIHPEGIMKLRMYSIRMYQRGKIKRQTLIREAREILSYVKVRKFDDKFQPELVTNVEEIIVTKDKSLQKRLGNILQNISGHFEDLNCPSQDATAAVAFGFSTVVFFCFILFRILPVKNGEIVIHN